jgi:HAE1 family hydrophobic/amphiphilic exporter-1
VPGLSSISREDGKITISANSDLEQWVVGTEIQPKLIEFAESYNYPIGISYVAGWENEENADLLISTVQSFVISLFLIFSILVFQFNSYSQPIIILYSVVLALLWVNIGLFITGNPYSMTFGIWFIALTW